MRKTTAYRFDLYGRYQILWTDEDTFLEVLFRVGIRAYTLLLLRIGFSMSSRHQHANLTTMGGTGPCLPMKIILGSVIERWYTSLNIKFGVNRTFHVLKTPVYRFDLYGIYRTLWTDDDNFWYRSLALAYKP